jgi:hypothetical protein
MGYIRDILGYTRDICIGIYWDILGDLEKSHHFGENYSKIMESSNLMKFGGSVMHELAMESFF